VYAKITKDEHQITQVNVKELLVQLEKSIIHPNTTRIEIEGTFQPVTYDKEMLEQVFYHLISNAIKFIDKPFGIIYVRSKEQEDRWVFSVADNGVGIDKVYFDKIFQPFQKVGSQNDSEIVGFGLTIVKKIVETFGGELWLESETEAGTTFFFTVPK
jgi:light-regulated signal transduction histidine kinase (bacteriophytochrome)